MKIRLSRFLVVLLLVMVVGVVAKGAAFAKTDFNWRQLEGEKITVFLSETPMAVAIREHIDEFIKLTGIEIEYLVVSENEYWSKLAVDLASGAGEFDVFMSGASLNWGYSDAGQIQPLDPFLNDPNLTPADWDFADFYDWAVASQRWDGTPGPIGLGKGHLWALPINQTNNLLTYRKDLFDQWGLKAPDTWDEWAVTARKIKELSGGQVDGKPFYAVAARGALDITTLSGPFFSGLFSYGASDFDDDLTPAMNKAPSVAFQKLYMDAIKDAGSPDWPNQMWFDVQQGFTSGQYGMVFDIDNFVIVYESKDSAVAGKLAYALPPAGPDGSRLSFPWCWGLTLNAQAKDKTAKAAWLFIVWASSKETMTAFAPTGSLPTRASVWNSPEVLELTGKWGDGSFRKTMDTVLAEHVRWLPAPMVDLPAVWTIWVKNLQKYYFGKGDMQEMMDRTAKSVTQALQDSGTLKE